jgi:ADP-heptose:LPS heptosyltransferase
VDWPQRVLICLRYGIGDVIMELPALRAVCAHWPHAHFTTLGAHPALELPQGDPDFNTQACVQDFGFAHWGDCGTATARRHFGDWFAEQEFDCVYSMLLTQ